MHLHQQARLQTLGVEPALHDDHRRLDQIGRRSLHRRVDRCAFGALATAGLAGADFGQPQATAENGFDIALCPWPSSRVLHVAATPG
jgi:hypothetical protein